VIEPHARKLLIEFDHFVRHYEVAFASEDLGSLNDGGHSKQITK
jgi:hypothetical protein